jgi:hypothetical protein
MTLRTIGPDPRNLVPNDKRARIEAKLLLDQVLLVPGLRLARDPATTPKETGQLIGSIRVSPARWKGDTLEGALVVGVEYGRFQEFRHPEKARYLQRAITAAQRALGKRLEGNAVLASLGLRAGARRGGA